MSVRKRVDLDTEFKAVAEARLTALLDGRGPALPTVRMLGEQWTSGELARRYPDHVRVKRSARDDAGRLANHVYPVIGNKPLDVITTDDCDEVMRRLPASAARSRAHIAGAMSRLFRLAVYPCKYLERSPLPPGYVPRRPPRKAMPWLYPDEDRALLALVAVPLEYRMLWGLLAREGMRAGEACALEWVDLDLRRGVLSLGKNKTDDPRAWEIDPGVHAALLWWRRQRAREPASALVFTRPDGRAHRRHELAPAFREHLKATGVALERPALFESTAERQRIRVHDLRGTFVTINLALGRSEAWIAARTGHRSSIMIARYKRATEGVRDLLAQTPFAPLDRAVPECSGEALCAQTKGT